MAPCLPLAARGKADPLKKQWTVAIVADAAGGGLSVTGAVAGLEASVAGGVHVHEGYSCDDATAVGGHYYDGLVDDPWVNATYASDATCVARGAGQGCERKTPLRSAPLSAVSHSFRLTSRRAIVSRSGLDA